VLADRVDVYSNIWRTATFKVDADLMSDIIDIYLSAVHPYTSIPGALMSCNMQMLTRHEIEIFAKNGGNALGIKPEDGPLFCKFYHLPPPLQSRVPNQFKARGR
jgi:hypothetical protein